MKGYGEQDDVVSFHDMVENFHERIQERADQVCSKQLKERIQLMTIKNVVRRKRKESIKKKYISMWTDGHVVEDDKTKDFKLKNRSSFLSKRNSVDYKTE